MHPLPSPPPSQPLRCVTSHNGGRSEVYDQHKNENNHHRVKQEPYLDRGDCVRSAEFLSHQSRTSGTFTKESTHFVFPEKDTARLNCTEGTFRVHKIYGDGNCMFRAVSYIIWQNEDEHRYLRITVVQHIKDNWGEYGPFVTAEWNISNSQEYYDYMSVVGTFASELECTVATRLYHMNLSIYREIYGRYELKRVFHNRVSGQYKTARLLFTGRSDSGHYDVLFPD
ncbi:hypothetical protein KM043_016998 [Ampulex compressa]|nr:hypothetical protein KM043_016998 [Ampulex compressa]